MFLGCDLEGGGKIGGFRRSDVRTFALSGRDSKRESITIRTHHISVCPTIE